MRVKEVPISDIRPYENNPRKNDDAVSKVAASIKEFGWKQPIVTDADGTIIVGHTRYKAAVALGLETVPVLVASDLTPEQAQAYRLADNKTGEFATWDFDMLADELDGLANFDMERFGFLEMPNIDDLFTDDDRPEAQEEKQHEVTCPECGCVFEV